MEVIFLDGRCRPSDLPKDAEFVVVLPYTQRSMAEAATCILASRSMSRGVIVAVEDTERTGFVSIANMVFRGTRSRLFGYLAQDAFPCRKWGEMVLRAFKDERRGLLAFNDGKWGGFLAAFGVVRRAWAEGNYDGNLFLPAYTGHYADVELSLLAMQDGVYCYDPNCVMMEVDYEKDLKPVVPEDRALFDRRKASNFDGRIQSSKLMALFS